MKLGVFKYGFPTAFYDRDLHGDNVPAEAVEITDEQWLELINHQGERRFVNGQVVAYTAPPEKPAPVVTVIYPADLWRRMTDAEVDAVEEAIASQPARIKRIFNAASVYRSDDELWPLLLQIATYLFGRERADEILSPSVGAQ